MRVAAALLTLVALALAGSAGARPDANGLPAYINGYAKWQKLNAKPIRGGSAAHQGVKNVYASKRKTGRRYPVGTIVVKTATPPGKRWLSLVATMRRIKGTTNGGWRWEEFTRGLIHRPLREGRLPGVRLRRLPHAGEGQRLRVHTAVSIRSSAGSRPSESRRAS